MADRDPIDCLEFWRDRIARAYPAVDDSNLHRSVYDMDQDVWENIQSAHREVLSSCIESGMKVLDAGCGYGALYDVMPTRRHFDYVGVDFSPDFIWLATQRHPGVKFQQVDLRKLPKTFRRKQFDLAICRSIAVMVRKNLGHAAWEEIEWNLLQVANRLLILEYESPADYFLPSPPIKTPTAVVCIPRSGSTYLWRSLVGLPPNSYTPVGYFGLGAAYPVKKLVPYTNSLPPNTKILFIFGDIVSSIISTKRNIYGPGHFRNCGYHKANIPNIYAKDFLAYERVFDQWTTNDRYPTLCIRYEALPDNFHRIEEFLGAPINFPPWRQRKTGRHSVSPPTYQKIEKTYATLIAKADAMSDVTYLNV